MYMQIAEILAQQSHSKRNKVGALIVKNETIIAIGFNGTPAGFDNKCEIKGKTKPEVLHAESNAIAKCAKSTISSTGSTLYTTLSPCINCAKQIIQCDIERIVYKDKYRKTDGLELLTKANIKTYRYHE